MKNENKKNKKNHNAGSADELRVVQYSTIKRMLGALDRFLTKQFMLVVAFCTSVIAVCILGLTFANETLGRAATPGGGDPSGNMTALIWLWSIIAVMVFVATVTTVYALGRRKKSNTNV